jgi:hypothetical protein
MFFWFLGGAFLIVWLVFRDPAFDYRLLLIGVLLPDVVDALLGGARVLHSVAFSVALLAVVMLATIGHRALRRQLIALPIGTFLHLVLDAAWADTDVFWWPFSGVGFEGDPPLPSWERGLWNLALELIGLAILAWAWRRFGMADPGRRRLFLQTGRLDRTLAGQGGA